MLTLTKLSKSYGEKQVLHDVSMDLLPGKVYGLVGENGAGKTTLFRCIAGLEPYEGQLESSHKPLKDVLGYLTSDSYFIPKITAEEHILLLTEARGIKLQDLAKRNLFDLPLKNQASSYSTGMKKKLALTAVLLQQNQYFILDEPYNGIDFQSAIILTAIIHRLKEEGKTILISSHIYSTLKDTCDEIFYLDEGQIKQRVEKRDFDKLEEEMKTKILRVELDRFFDL